MNYSTETWLLTIGLIRKLKVAQKAMERAIFGDEMMNGEICANTNDTDII